MGCHQIIFPFIKMIILLGLCPVFLVYRIGYSLSQRKTRSKVLHILVIVPGLFLGFEKGYGFLYRPRKQKLYIDITCNHRLCERIRVSALSYGCRSFLNHVGLNGGKQSFPWVQASLPNHVNLVCDFFLHVWLD